MINRLFHFHKWKETYEVLIFKEKRASMFQDSSRLKLAIIKTCTSCSKRKVSFLNWSERRSRLLNGLPCHYEDGRASGIFRSDVWLEEII